MIVRRGTTLLELLVVLAILAAFAMVVVTAMPPASAPLDSPRSLVREARVRALETRRTVTIATEINGRIVEASAYPDGRVIADSLLGVDRLTGRTVRLWQHDYAR